MKQQGHIFPRHTKAVLPTAVSGDGVYIIDADGKRYLDACGGAAVSCLGHSDKKVTEAIQAQLDRIPFAHTSFFTSEPAEGLADDLIELAPEGIERVYFVSGGSEAVEAALKLSRQYFMERGEGNRRNVIARWQSYHGNTLGALSAGGNRWRRAQFEPLLVGAMHHIAPCHAYRYRHEGESEEAYSLRAANELEAKILELGPETVAAFIAEPVVGATMGAVPATKGYFTRIREICDKYGILLILDEVMCGVGRTGTFFASEQDEDVRPDMVTIAKGLGAGYQPIGALLVSGEIYDAIASGSGFFQHGHTYIGHPAACAGSRAVLDRLNKDELISNVEIMGTQLDAQLRDRFADHPYIGDIRGRGLFRGLEIVADRVTKEPFEPALKINAKIKRSAMGEGLMCYPMGGTVDGERGDHVLLAPPYIINETHVSQIVDKLALSMEIVFAEVSAA